MTTLASRLPRSAPRAAFGKIVLNEARLAWRVPVGLFAGIALPVLLVVVFGELPKFQIRQPSLGGLTDFDIYIPILLVMGITLLALWGLPSPVVTYREQGILRRLSTTPVPPSWLLAAQVVVQLCVALFGILVVLVVGITVFGAPVPKSIGGLALSVALTVAGLFCIGLAIAGLARTYGQASAVGRLTFFPLMFFAGLWLPIPFMPSVLQDISDYTPVGAAVEAMSDSMKGQFPPTAPLLCLVGYALVFGFVAQRYFKWE